MAFLIRTIDVTATGREIVRERTLEQDTLTIGRAAENDLHLPDLSVEQHHARIVPGTGRQLRAEAIGSLGFRHDGKTATEAVFNPHEGTELEFGSYRLAFSQDGDGPVAVTITQKEQRADVHEAVKGFALASALPGKRVVAWAGLIAILALFLAIPIYTNLTRTPVKPDIDKPGQTVMDASWSSGPLSLAHHGLEDNCEACHVKPFVSVRDESCLACHKDIGDHAPIPRQNKARGPLPWGDAIQWSIAETFGKEGPGSCTTCHTEHEGACRMEPTQQKFCAECHDGMNTRLTDTKLANAADFGTAHPQFKAVFFGTLGSKQTMRMSLDQHPREQNGLKFPHRLHLDPNGGVARMAGNIGAKHGYGSKLECADCHVRAADGVSFKPIEMEQACEACHSLVYDKVGDTFRTLRHGDVAQMRADLAAMDRTPRRPIVTGRRRPGEFDRGGLYYQNFGPPVANYLAINQALGPRGVCGECHIPTTIGGRPDVVPVHLQQRYITGGWFDHDDHKKEKCSSCHKADASTTSSDLLLPGIANCRECHLGQYARKAKVPSSCAMCHNYHPAPMGLPRQEDRGKPEHVALMSRKPG